MTWRGSAGGVGALHADLDKVQAEGSGLARRLATVERILAGHPAMSATEAREEAKRELVLADIEKRIKESRQRNVWTNGGKLLK
jgi:hypothetical protein